MADLKDEIARLIHDAEQAAYRRGWSDALDNIRRDIEARSQQGHPSPNGFQTEVYTEPRRTGRPASNAVHMVEATVNASPGSKGVEVVKAVQLIEPTIPERTVRTALRRLKIHKRIWQRDGKWYPKSPRQRDLLETNDEEANPPHH